MTTITANPDACQGHPDDGVFNGPMGQTFYCDGSCHVCDDRLATDGGDMEYVGHIAAPGYGVAYRCMVCDAPRVRLGSTMIDPRDHDPIELSPADVI